MQICKQTEDLKIAQYVSREDVDLWYSMPFEERVRVGDPRGDAPSHDHTYSYEKQSWINYKEDHLSNFMSKEEAEKQISDCAGEAQPFLVCLLGGKTGWCNHDKFEESCDPQSVEEGTIFFNRCLNRCLIERKTMLLVVACHGSDQKENYELQFGGESELVMEARMISESVHLARKMVAELDATFKCVGLIEACYANYFDVTCFDASITAGEGINRPNVLQDPLLQCMQKKEFTLGQIFTKMSEKFAILSCFDCGDDNKADFKTCKINGNYRFKQ